MATMKNPPKDKGRYVNFNLRVSTHSNPTYKKIMPRQTIHR